MRLVIKNKDNKVLDLVPYYTQEEKDIKEWCKENARKAKAHREGK